MFECDEVAHWSDVILDALQSEVVPAIYEEAIDFTRQNYSIESGLRPSAKIEEGGRYLIGALLIALAGASANLANGSESRMKGPSCL